MFSIPHRPLTSERPLVETLAKLQLPTDLVQGRRQTSRPSWPTQRPEREWVVDITLTWPTDDRSDRTLVILPTRQRLGGVRWWWSCPSCGRRCRFLLAET